MRFAATHPLFALVENGGIETDGSEELVTLVPEGEPWRVGPLIHRDDGTYVFENFEGHQDNRPATPENRGFYRLRRKAGQGEGKAKPE